MLALNFLAGSLFVSSANFSDFPAMNSCLAETANEQQTNDKINENENGKKQKYVRNEKIRITNNNENEKLKTLDRKENQKRLFFRDVRRGYGLGSFSFCCDR